MYPETKLQMLDTFKTLFQLRIAKIDRTYFRTEIKKKQESKYKFFNITLLAYHLSRQGVNGLHLYHIIKPSKWPALMAINLFALAVGFVVWVLPETNKILSNFNLYIIFISFLSVFYFWCFDLMNEAGEHNKRIRQGIKLGMILFILSEFMFFFAFFWAYLHSSTNPSIFIGHIWPPLGQASLLIESITLPFLNTLLLLTSGLCVTLAHKFSSILFSIEESVINLKFRSVIKTFVLTKKKLILCIEKLAKIIFSFNYMRHILRVGLVVALLLTIVLAVIFTNIQYNEYVESKFNITDGIYASCFYLMTGFHGIHVIIGTIFLIACFIQVKAVKSFYKEMTGLECAIWYWHFVDIVWLFLYIIVYLIADDAYQRVAKMTLIERLNNLDKVFNNFAHGCIEYKAIGFASPKQKYFNFPATTSMSEIIWLHDYIMFFIIIILFVVLALFYGILRDYTTVFLYEKYLKFVDYRVKMGGYLYASTKGKGFNAQEDKKYDEATTRGKTY